jgi:hypothetical protein
MNGPAAKTVKVDLRFLGKGRYQALIVRDKPDDAAAVELDRRDVTRASSLQIVMRAAGGFVVRLSPGPAATALTVAPATRNGFVVPRIDRGARHT